MAMHIQLTMIIFFINMILSFLFPQFIFLSDNVYSTNEYGDAVISEGFSNSLGLDDKDISVGSLGIIDALLLVWDFIKYIFSFIFALPVLIYVLPMAAAVKIGFFFPVLLLYAFTLMAWVRGN